MSQRLAPPPPIYPPAPAPARNIVLCLDGTSNLFKDKNTNTLKLFQVCRRDAAQLAYYDPGVGTLGDASYKTPIGRGLNKMLGGAFGAGLLKNVEEAYSYLMEHHQEGDRIFLFGFSRGAYTARVLAGFINRCGLFEKGCQNLIPYALQMFLEQPPQGADEGEVQAFFKLRSSFRRTYGRRFTDQDGKLSHQAPIHFLGLWDTVKSYGWLYDTVNLPGEQMNESVRTVRHAIAIDEKRVFFPQMHWSRKGASQDAREVWFAGVHTDVGGGELNTESGLSMIPLDWMLSHARDAGLLLVDQDYQHLVNQERFDDLHGDKAVPNHAADQHESLAGPWRVLEALPWRGPDGSLRLPRFPSARARVLPRCMVFHRSVLSRMMLPAGVRIHGRAERKDYRPTQLPQFTPQQVRQLDAGEALLLAATDQVPARLLLPLVDTALKGIPRAGEILMLALKAPDHAFLHDGWSGNSLQAVHRLAQRCTDAMLLALPKTPGAAGAQDYRKRFVELMGQFAPPMPATPSLDFTGLVNELTRLKNPAAKTLDKAQKAPMLLACEHLIDALVTVAARQTVSPRTGAVALPDPGTRSSG